MVKISQDGPSELSRLLKDDLIEPLDDKLLRNSNNIYDDISKTAVKNQLPNIKRNTFIGLQKSFKPFKELQEGIEEKKVQEKTTT